MKTNQLGLPQGQEKSELSPEEEEFIAQATLALQNTPQSITIETIQDMVVEIMEVGDAYIPDNPTFFPLAVFLKSAIISQNPYPLSWLTGKKMINLLEKIEKQHQSLDAEKQIQQEKSHVREDIAGITGKEAQIKGLFYLLRACGSLKIIQHDQEHKLSEEDIISIAAKNADSMDIGVTGHETQEDRKLIPPENIESITIEISPYHYDHYDLLIHMDYVQDGIRKRKHISVMLKLKYVEPSQDEPQKPAEFLSEFSQKIIELIPKLKKEQNYKLTSETALNQRELDHLGIISLISYLYKTAALSIEQYKRPLDEIINGIHKVEIKITQPEHDSQNFKVEIFIDFKFDGELYGQKSTFNIEYQQLLSQP